MLMSHKKCPTEYAPQHQRHFLQLSACCTWQDRRLETFGSSVCGVGKYDPENSHEIYVVWTTIQLLVKTAKYCEKKIFFFSQIFCFCIAPRYFVARQPLCRIYAVQRTAMWWRHSLPDPKKTASVHPPIHSARP